VKLKSKLNTIFYTYSSGKQTEDLWQYVHFFDELKSLGIKIIPFDIANYQPHHEEVLLKKLKAEKDNISLFMTELNDFQISDSSIKEIKKYGIPTLLICYDNLTIPFVHKRISACVDLTWLTSFETEGMFKNWGATTIFMPYAANPNVFQPNLSTEIGCVGFPGSLYGSRSYKIATISSSAIPVNLYTNQNIENNILQHSNYYKTNSIAELKKRLSYNLNYFSFNEGRKLLKSNYLKAIIKRIERKIVFNEFVTIKNSVSFDEMIKLYSNFALSLGITEVWNTYLLKKPLYKLHLRTFEIPMCGGLQITNRTSEIENYFEDGKEIILYNSDNELIDKARFYLKEENTTLRLKMKLAARQRAENEHTWSHRFTKIHDTLFK